MKKKYNNFVGNIAKEEHDTKHKLSEHLMNLMNGPKFTQTECIIDNL